MQRSRIVLALATSMLMVGGLCSFWVVGTRVTPVTIDDAVERYRAGTAVEPAGEETTETPTAAPKNDDVAAEAGAPEPALARSVRPAVETSESTYDDTDDTDDTVDDPDPEPGVYVYRTTGYEEISVGVGAEHQYPDETTMTVTPTPCGSDVRWDALEERWAVWSHCSGGGELDLRRFVTHHEFFGQVEERTFHCASPTLMRIADDVPGAAASSQCEGDGSVADLTTTVVGRETVDVGGEAVETVHVRVDQVLSGNTEGERASDLWLARSNGLLVRLVDMTDIDTDSVFGRTHYYEEFDVRLTSTEPLR